MRSTRARLIQRASQRPKVPRPWMLCSSSCFDPTGSLMADAMNRAPPRLRLLLPWL